MSEKPLDLKDFEIIGVKIPEKAWRVLVSGEKFNEERFRKYWKTTSDDENIYRNVIITQMIEICKESIRLTSKEIKQRIKEACEFYLRYKNNPDLLYADTIEYDEILDKMHDEVEKKYTFLSSINIYRIYLEKYNEWLLREAFKDIFEDKEENE